MRPGPGPGTRTTDPTLVWVMLVVLARRDRRVAHRGGSGRGGADTVILHQDAVLVALPLRAAQEVRHLSADPRERGADERAHRSTRVRPVLRAHS